MAKHPGLDAFIFKFGWPAEEQTVKIGCAQAVYTILETHSLYFPATMICAELCCQITSMETFSLTLCQI